MYTDSVAETRNIDGKECHIYQPDLEYPNGWGSEWQWYYMYKYPDGNPWMLFKDGTQVVTHYEKELEYLLFQDILTYDFGAEKGAAVSQKNRYTSENEPAHWEDSIEEPRVVIRDREAELFGETRRVQHISSQWKPSEVYVKYDFIASEYMWSFVQIEDMGAITSPGTFAVPCAYWYHTGASEGEGSDIPRFSGVRTRDGKYSYSRMDLGVRSYNQLLDETHIWEYYSETPQTESVHYMSFKGTMERDGENYGIWGTDSVVSRDRMTGVITLSGGRDESAMWLMRENVGEIFVRGLDDGAPEVKVYDFMLQTGQEFPTTSGGTSLTARIMPVTKLDITSARYDTDGMVKTYSFEGMTDVLGITEYIGLWGDGTGHLASPAFMGGCVGYEEGNPLHPAPDCTLSRFKNIYGKQYYESPIYTDKVRPLLEAAAASVRMTGAEPELTPKYYNLQGQRVTAPAKGDILIRVTGSRRDKVIF